MDLKDFKINQSVWIKLTGNAKRFKKEEESLVQEWKITQIGRKYIYAKKDENSLEVAFYKSNSVLDDVWIEKTEYSIDYILYATYQDYLDTEEAERISSELYNFFQHNGLRELSLYQLREIQKIINNNVPATYNLEDY